MVRRQRRGSVAVLVASALLGANCGGGGGGGSSVGTSEVLSVDTSLEVLISEKTTTSTTVAVDSSFGPPTSAMSTSTSGQDTTETSVVPEVMLSSALGSVATFIESWAAVVSYFPEKRDLAPTIGARDVIADDALGVDIFVEQATPGTVIGGVVDPDTGRITGLMGLSDPASGETSVVIEIIWVAAFGLEELPSLAEKFTETDLAQLEIGQQITREHLGHSIVLNRVDGAEPGDGLLVLTVGAEDLIETDPTHDTISNAVIGLLVRTP